jgi:hypothetical protein
MFSQKWLRRVSVYLCLNIELLESLIHYAEDPMFASYHACGPFLFSIYCVDSKHLSLHVTLLSSTLGKCYGNGYVFVWKEHCLCM